MRAATKIAWPCVPMAGKVSGLAAAMRISGHGFCSDLGASLTLLKVKYLPFQEKRSSLKASLTISRVSAKRSRLSP